MAGAIGDLEKQMKRQLPRIAWVTVVVAATFTAESRAENWVAQGGPRIVAFEVRGNKALNKEFIVTISGVKVGDVATPAVVEAAKNALLASGYFGMRRIDDSQKAIKVSVADIDPTTNEGKLLIQVEENEVVRHFSIRGNGPISRKAVRTQLHTRPGFVLNINTLRADVDRIQKYYDSKGFIATVSDEGFGLTNGVLDIPILVGRIGPSQLLTRGLSGADERVARRVLARVLSPGHYYNIHELAAALKRLEKHGIVLKEPDACLFPPRLNDIRLSIALKKSN